MSDFFPSWSMKPNPQCDNQHCQLRQQEHQRHHKLTNQMRSYTRAMTGVRINHPLSLPHASLPYDWGITLVDETSPVDEPLNSDQVTEGLQFAYTLPQQQSNQEDNDTALVADTEGMSVEQLVQQLKNL